MGKLLIFLGTALMIGAGIALAVSTFQATSSAYHVVEGMHDTTAAPWTFPAFLAVFMAEAHVRPLLTAVIGGALLLGAGGVMELMRYRRTRSDRGFDRRP